MALVVARRSPGLLHPGWGNSTRGIKGSNSVAYHRWHSSLTMSAVQKNVNPETPHAT